MLKFSRSIHNYNCTLGWYTDFSYG